ASAQSDLRLTIIEPGACSRGIARREPGKPLKIRGSATDPSGVKEVLVNDRPVVLEPDRGNRAYSLFTTYLQPDSIYSLIRVRLVPVSGTEAIIDCRTDGPPRPTPVIVGVDSQKPTPPSTACDSTPAVARTGASDAPDLWQPFHHRAIGYGIAGGVGAVV